MKWCYRDAQGMSVEFSKSDMPRLFRSGKLYPSTEVWNPSMGSWKPAIETELAELFPTGSAEKRYSDTEGAAYLFENPLSHTTKLIRSLNIYLVGVGICCVTETFAIVKGRPISDDFTAFDALELFGALAAFCGLLASVVGFIRWTKRMSINAHAMSDHRLKYSPKFAMWSYLIPFVNLWVPRIALGEIWQTSYAKSQRGEMPSRSLLNLWWAAFIISNSVDNIVAKNTSETEAALWLSVGSYGLNILLALAAIRVVKNISSTQIAYAEGRKLD